MLIQTIPYNSLYFKGGSWMEIAIIDSMKLNQNANDFSLQFWVSGGEMTTSDAPALFSLIDAQDSIKLALFRDRGSSNRITWTTNSISNNEVIDDEYNNKLDWSDPDMFYLISLLFSDNQGIKGYFNDEIFLNIPDNIEAGDAKLMIGARINDALTIRDHFWYGYIDEIRLWNTLLADSTIKFQYEHPDKLGDYYRQTYEDSLIGLWRFNLSEPIFTIVDESEHGNDGIIYTLDDNYSIELSEKGVQ